MDRPVSRTESPLLETCLDKDKVQKQIRLALKYKKNIIVVLENDGKSTFDLKAARLKYSGTEWEPILDLAEAKPATKEPTDSKPATNHGILYEREESQAKKMIDDIFALKSAGSGARPSSPPQVPTELDRTSSPESLALEPVRSNDSDADQDSADVIYNKPGQWTFFLNHELQTSDQMVVLKLRLQTDNRESEPRATVWQIDSMEDKSEKAIEEGVRNSECFILYLTSEAAGAGAGAAKPMPGEGPQNELRASTSIGQLSEAAASREADTTAASPKPEKVKLKLPDVLRLIEEALQMNAETGQTQIPRSAEEIFTIAKEQHDIDVSTLTTYTQKQKYWEIAKQLGIETGWEPPRGT